MFPPSNNLKIKSNHVVYALAPPYYKAFMDTTRHLPHFSSKGKEYIFITFYYDSSAIICAPSRNCQAVNITSVLKRLYTTNSIRQSCIRTHRFWIMKHQKIFCLVCKSNKQLKNFLPHIYRANDAQRAILIFKDHLKFSFKSWFSSFRTRQTSPTSLSHYQSFQISTN